MGVTLAPGDSEVSFSTSGGYPNPLVNRTLRLNRFTVITFKALAATRLLRLSRDLKATVFLVSLF